MRRISVASLDCSASIVGMGCASLGSRVGRREGLRALNRAFDAGVTWFDVAPSYGDAEAEKILGAFARGKRDKMLICTKVGIRPARTPFAMRAAKPILRCAVYTVPMLRKYVTRARPAPTKLAITPEMISSSLDASLRRLQTDHIDVLALHEADQDEVLRGNVHERWSELFGSARRGPSQSPRYWKLAYSASLTRTFTELFRSRTIHSSQRWRMHLTDYRKDDELPLYPTVFMVLLGLSISYAKRIKSDATKLQMLRDEGYNGNIEEAAAAFLADYALATNRDGITLFSMLKKEHLDFNLRRLGQLPPTARMERLAQALTAA